MYCLIIGPPCSRPPPPPAPTSPARFIRVRNRRASQIDPRDATMRHALSRHSTVHEIRRELTPKFTKFRIITWCAENMYQVRGTPHYSINSSSRLLLYTSGARSDRIRCSKELLSSVESAVKCIIDWVPGRYNRYL